MNMAPYGVSLLYNANDTGAQCVRNHGWELHRVTIEGAGALAEDGRRHDKICGYTDGLAGLDDSDVGGAWGMSLSRLAVLFESRCLLRR